MARADRVSVRLARRRHQPIVGPRLSLLRRERRLGARLAGALDTLPHGFCLFDAGDRLVFANDGYRRLFGQQAGQPTPGLHASRLIAINAASGLKADRDPARIWAERRQVLARRDPATMLETLSDGRQIALTLQPQPDGGWVALYEDVTERRRAESLLRHRADHDPLTGLPNRALFETRLDRATAESDARGCALLCIDLDGFKPINDRYGHAAGDSLLRQVAERLREGLGARDMAARLGGDEFALLLDESAGSAVLDRAHRIQRRLTEPYAIGGGQAVRVGAAIGIARAPQNGTQARALVERADAAMYASKRRGHPCLWSEAPRCDPIVHDRP